MFSIDVALNDRLRKNLAPGALIAFLNHVRSFIAYPVYEERDRDSQHLDATLV